MSVTGSVLKPAVPGLVWGDYPERAEPADPKQALRSRRRAPGWARGFATWLRRAQGVQAQSQRWNTWSDADFDAWLPKVQARLHHDGFTADALDTACACVVQAVRRTMGRQPFDQQVMAALCMLDNRLVEMGTGEGKSLATAMAAALAALAGIPVHVFTANDYLVARDAQAFQPLFLRLGLDVGAVLTGQAPKDRRRAYQQAIVYATARELAFDYLRDRLRHGSETSAMAQRLRAQTLSPEQRPLLRGLCMAIVDEADSVLIDDATLPLILSRRVRDPAARAFLWQAWIVSGRLEDGEDFEALPGTQQVRLTEVGRQHLEALAQGLPAVWKNTLHREETVRSALLVRHLLHRDQDYLVRADTQGEPRIELVDRVTGRVAQGRRWSAGVHALVALKEGLVPEDETETLSRITFQRFFRRYHRLAGMSGTLVEARSELRSLYGLDIVRVPHRLPVRRLVWPTRCFRTDAERWIAVAQRVSALAAQGRPVLVGTDSVEASQQLSAVLQVRCVAHVVLNAHNDGVEAVIVAEAGRAGRVTVSTHLAGRGTDILLSPQALAAGGLHVLNCQCNGSRRLDRQLCGRAGRQGEPGSSEHWLSLESVRRAGHTVTAGTLATVAAVRGAGTESSGPVGACLDGVVAMSQWALEDRQSAGRRALFRQDTLMEGQLSFCGTHTS